jgi:6-phosphogluconolactonase
MPRHRSALALSLTVLAGSLLPALAAARSLTAGAVYAATNSFAGNEIVVYERAADGALTQIQRAATGGRGSGLGLTHPVQDIDPLGAQNSLVLSPDHRFLFAVNAGSDEISSFRVRPHGLELADKVPSGGSFPNSLAVHDDLLYVINSGGDANITGFRVDGDGELTAIHGSARSLHAGGSNPPDPLANPGQVSFTADGRRLIIDHKGPSLFLVFAVGHDGRPSAAPVVTQAAGYIPFSFIIGPGGAIVSDEVFGTHPPNPNPTGDSAASSYTLRPDGTLAVLTASLPTFQTAECWIDWDGGSYVYSSNTNGNTLTGFRVDRNGRLALLQADGVAYAYPNPTAFPADIKITPDGRFLYTLNQGAGTISTFRIERNGNLTPVGEAGGLPVYDGAEGLAVR